MVYNGDINECTACQAIVPQILFDRTIQILYKVYIAWQIIIRPGHCSADVTNAELSWRMCNVIDLSASLLQKQLS